MSNVMMILDILIVLGLVVSAVMAVHFEKLLSAVISLGVTGLFAAAAFLLMHAPDVAISEAAVGAALTPLIFIVALIKIRGGDDKTYEGQNATVPVAVLQQNPEAYDDSTADGAAAAIVQQNLAKTHAVNDVTSVVFDFRGYDTMGEAFKSRKGGDKR